MSEFWNDSGAQRGDGARILWLDDPRCQETGLVGGKAAGLARLAASHNVPPGFAISRVSASRTGDLPPSLCADVESAYGELGKRCSVENPEVAVRSSAVDEDGTETSFAGMHDTFLNVTGLDPLLDALQKIRASAASERALAYRHRRGLPVDDIQIAALVQGFVPADVSGVAFSLNPVTGSQDEIIINASWGLGESIVGGTVTPDTITVRKSDLAVVKQKISCKMRMTVPVAGGTVEVAVPRLLQGKPCLDETDAQAIAKITRQLEDQLGAPVDMECAFADGELFLLQCRPVTA